MNYTALYRKFRPTSFDEMVGQEHITRTLKNQIIAGRVGHAYLFNGGRGTGKTSAAKILARAVNCLNPQNGEPCNECEICKEAIAGSLTDIVEMDAASNNGVDDIRQLREEVNFLPTKAKYRVYIIDEVHMLSTGAFNALLKTLEEPPEHVKFILATTEPQKLPATILSRCQRFDFKQISNEDIIKRLKIVCNEMKLEITEEALKVISVLAEGGMRDALSILERCLQDGETNIDEDKVKDLVGIPKLTYINKIVNAIINNDVNSALEIVDQVVSEGKDIQNFLWEIIKYVKDILVYKASKNLNIYSKEEIEEINNLSESLSKEELLNIIYSLSSLENDMKYSSQKLVLMQVEIIKLCSTNVINNNSNSNINSNTNTNTNTNTNINSNSNSNKEVSVNNSNSSNNNVTLKVKEEVKSMAKKALEQEVQKEVVKEEKIEDKKEDDTKTSSIDDKDIVGKNTVSSWPKIINELKDSGKIMLYTNLINSVANQVNDMAIEIEFPKGLTPFGKTILERSENISELERRLSLECGKPMRVKYIVPDDNSKPKVEKDNSIQNFAKGNDIPFNIVDE